MKKNEYCIVDTTPLVALAVADSLPLLTAATEYFHFKMLDAVELEACFPGKPGAKEIADWIDKMKKDGKLDIVETEVGRELKSGRLQDPEFTMKGAGEQAICEWIESGEADDAKENVIVFADKKFGNFLERLSRDANIDAASPLGFLELGEKYGFIDSAKDSWQKIITAFPTCYPVNEIFQVCRKVPKI